MTAFQAQVAAVVAGSTTIALATEEIFQQLTEEEQLWMLDGDVGFKDWITAVATEGYSFKPQEAGVIDRLGIPGIKFSDGPRGVLLAGRGTAFPTSSARAATFNPSLEEKVVSIC